MPLRGPILEELHLLLSFDLPHVGRPPEGGDYLLYPIQPQANGKGSEGPPGPGRAHAATGLQRSREGETRRRGSRDAFPRAPGQGR
jgi:hypothetical protein